jgi:hypothetical protein
MIGARQHHARFHSDFYRESYHKILNALLFSCVIILALIAAIIYLILSKPSPNYYATTMSGQIIRMIPMVKQ